MTEEERLEWERKNPKAQKAQASKQKYKFLQKYYHKGAFFQEASDDKFGTQGSEEIYTRDYTEAVAEENLDKSILPKVSMRPTVMSCRTKGLFMWCVAEAPATSLASWVPSCRRCNSAEDSSAAAAARSGRT